MPSRLESVQRLVRPAVAVGMAVAALGVWGAGAASAAIATDYTTAGVAIRSAPNGAVLGLGYAGDRTDVQCGVWAKRSGEPGVDYWVLNRNSRTGIRGWSASTDIAGTSTFVPRC